MRLVRLLTLVAALALVVSSSGCGRIFRGRTGPAKGHEAPAGIGIPAAVTGVPGGTFRLPENVYLASLITMGVTAELGMPVAIGPNVGTFSTGDIRFVILNKWGGLSVGRHREEVVVLAPDGKTVLAKDQTEFEYGREAAFTTIVTPLSFAAREPGFYHVMVSLDGTPVAQYRFQVREPNQERT